jgi:hypothetical protein
MIPARYLPPKFDYSRELPASMLQSAAASSSASSSSSSSAARNAGSDDGDDDLEMGNITETTRLRSTSASDEPSPTVAAPPAGGLECVICYDAVDPGDRSGYMLAPCEHIFHKECLTQWMDVKMECPVCRGALPEI